MCGIIGVFGNKNSAELVKTGLSVLKNRGNDNFGIISGDNDPVYSKKVDGLKTKKSDNSIGHCLHSIVGFVKQPIRTKEDCFAVNCEIYNWNEIKKKHDLKSNNDSELIFEFLKKNKTEKILETIAKLDGVYAFSWWHQNKVYLARDIMGIKPLWYSTNSGLSFASEKKALEEMGFLDIHELNPRKVLVYDIKKNKISFLQREFFSITPELKISKKKIEKDVEELLIKAIKKRIPEKKFGILFSGGIDSVFIAFILKKLGYDFTCYTAALDDPSLKEPKDIYYAKKAAKLIGLDLKIKKITLDEMEKTIKKVIPIIEDTNVVKTGVAVPFYVACEEAKKDGCKVIFSGLGSEEIFAGYERHKNSININKECVSGLLKMYERDLYRDDVITMYNSIELRLPLLDLDLVKYALRIPPKYKLNSEQSKLILRDVAKKLGVPKEICKRKKTAAQYGSNFHKGLIKLTKKAKEKYISAYLRQFYKDHNLRLGALFSSGKDSSYALWVMKNQNYAIDCLISLRSKNPDSYMFHTPNIDLVEHQAKSMGIPLISYETEGIKETELEDLEKALILAKKKHKIQGVVTGALFSNYQRERIEKILDKLELKIFAPLWHVPQEQELKEIINSGFEVTMSSIAADGLDKKWLGKIITHDDLKKLIDLNEKIGFNVAGEGGEYESLVLDSPMFEKKIKIIESEIIAEDKYTGRLIVKKAELVDKK
ncbi:MAG: diphthine--ammonia ligase [Candidatus Woesearchaeota archaeon]